MTDRAVLKQTEQTLIAVTSVLTRVNSDDTKLDFFIGELTAKGDEYHDDPSW